MIATMIDGTVQELEPGANPCGSSIAAVTITYDDLHVLSNHAALMRWLNEDVFPRVVPS